MEHIIEHALDLAALNEQTFHDAAIRSEVIQLFDAQAPALIAALSATTGQARADIAHRLKGSALALGAMPLAEAASLLEQHPDSPEALRDVSRWLDASLQALRQLSA